MGSSMKPFNLDTTYVEKSEAVNEEYASTMDEIMGFYLGMDKTVPLNDIMYKYDMFMLDNMYKSFMRIQHPEKTEDDEKLLLNGVEQN